MFRKILILRLLAISLRNLSNHKVRSALTGFGIVIGVAAVIGTYSISTGLNLYVEKQIKELGSDIIYIIADNLKISDQRLVETYGKGVQGTTLYAKLNTTIQNRKNIAENINLSAVDTGYSKVFKQSVTKGRYLNPEEINLGIPAAVIGSKLSKKLFGTQNPVGEKFRVLHENAIVSFYIAGVKDPTGRYDVDNGYDIPLKTLQRYLVNIQPNQFAISATSKDNVSFLMTQIKSILRPEKKSVDVMSASEYLKFAENVASKITAVGIVLATLCLLVGGIGLMNIMLVSVIERRSEIGVKRALGFSRSLIQSQFLIEAVVVCLIGGAIGFLIGAITSKALSVRVLNFEAVISVEAGVLAILVSIGIGMVFGIAPAKRAAALEPVEALRE